MKSDVFIFFSLLIIAISFNLLVAAEEIENTLSGEENKEIKHEEVKHEHKVLLECEHSDYRTYIKCLKRQKRQHGHIDHHRNDTRMCLDECAVERCTSHRCIHDCHTRCLKRTKETTQIITQYETECVTDDCDKSKGSNFPVANITTNIDINNNIDARRLPQGGGSPDSPVPPGHPGHPGHPGSPRPPYPPFSIVPQISLVPQITFGITPNFFGGCIYSGSWPCLPQNNGFDCTQCNNPFWRVKCDSWCYNADDPNVGMINVNNQTGCRSPHCIGGT